MRTLCSRRASSRLYTLPDLLVAQPWTSAADATSATTRSVLVLMPASV
jgi:hypothetical protein